MTRQRGELFISAVAASSNCVTASELGLTVFGEAMRQLLAHVGVVRIFARNDPPKRRTFHLRGRRFIKLRDSIRARTYRLRRGDAPTARARRGRKDLRA